MFHNNPFIESKNAYVTVWLGDLNELELEEYLEEPGNAGDNDPISKFSQDLGRWYDHDFIWAEAVDKAIPVSELCILNGIDSVHLIDKIVKQSQQKEAKTLLILWNSKKVNGTERRFANNRLHCIGSWEHESPLAD